MKCLFWSYLFFTIFKSYSSRIRNWIPRLQNVHSRFKSSVHPAKTNTPTVSRQRWKKAFVYQQIIFPATLQNISSVSSMRDIVLEFTSSCIQTFVALQELENYTIYAMDEAVFYVLALCIIKIYITADYLQSKHYDLLITIINQTNFTQFLPWVWHKTVAKVCLNVKIIKTISKCHLREQLSKSTHICEK